MTGTRTRVLAIIFFAAAWAAASSTGRAQLAGEPSPTNPKNIYDEAAKTPGQEERLTAKNSEEKVRRRREILEEEQDVLDAAEARSDQQRNAAQQRAAKARAASLGYLQTGNPESLPRLFEDDRMSVIGSFNAAAAPFLASNNAFAAPAGSINSGRPVNPSWAELYLQPGFTAAYHLAHHTYLYGGFSYIESATLGSDYAGSPYAWYGSPEELYAGLRVSHLFGGRGTLDVSYGQQNYANGDGMLLSSGADNGAARGAPYLGPRTAWREAALVKLTDGDWSTQLFYLRPNEAPAAFDNTRLTGINVVWNPPGQLRLGAQYIYAASDIATRNQMSTYEFRARLHPLARDPNFWIQADYAFQGKPYLIADGWMLQANYNFNKMWWKPFVNIGYYDLSGANPANSLIWYGFDPLYFGGVVPAWLPGFALQTVLANTNLRYFNTSLFLEPRKNDWLQISYLAASVNQLNATLPNFAYGSELGATYTHYLTPALSLTPFYAVAVPGNGIEANYKAHGGSARNWSFLGMAFAVSY